MRKYHLHIALIVLGTILYFMANFQRVAIPGAIFDTLQLDLNLSAPYITSLGAVFMYAYALSLLVIGLLVDKFSGLKVILFGGILFTIGSFLFANSDSLFILYASRAILGAGAATFYLSLVQELKKCFPDRYFGISISILLFVGNLGGVCANAPFVFASHFIGWRAVLNILGIVILMTTFSYAIVKFMLKHIPENKKVHFSLEPFIEVFKNHHNVNLFIFAGLNYGLYYVIQTVIGSKFLKDFTHMPLDFSATILSIMVVVAAIAGIGLATMSKLCGNRRVIFMRSISIMSTIIFAIICICLIFNIQTQLIAILLLFLPICGGMSPLLVPIIHGTNKHEVQGTALSIMTCLFFLVVGILGTLTGFLLELFKPVANFHGHSVYGNWSYLCVFAVFFILSLIELYNVFKLKDVTT